MSTTTDETTPSTTTIDHSASWRARIQDDRLFDDDDSSIHQELEGAAESWRTCAVGDALGLSDIENGEYLNNAMHAIPELCQRGCDFGEMISDREYEAAGAALDRINSTIDKHGGPEACRKTIAGELTRTALDKMMTSIHDDLIGVHIDVPGDPGARARLTARFKPIRERIEAARNANDDAAARDLLTELKPVCRQLQDDIWDAADTSADRYA